MAVPLLPLGINLSHFVMAKYLNIEEQASKTRGGGENSHNWLAAAILTSEEQVRNMCVCVIQISMARRKIISSPSYSLKWLQGNAMCVCVLQVRGIRVIEMRWDARLS